MRILQRAEWHGGQLLAYSAIDGPTDFDHALTLRTSFQHPGLDIKLPGHGAIRFSTPMEVDHWFTGDCFETGFSAGRIRGAFLDACHLLIEGPCEVSGLTDELASLQEEHRTLIGAARHFDSSLLQADMDRAIEARLQWIKSLNLPGNLSEQTRRTLTKMLSIMKTQVYSAQGSIKHRWTTPDRWPHRSMWLWDSVFHSIGWRHVDPMLAAEAIHAVLDTQQRDGFIAHIMNPHSISEITQPPVLALGVKLVHEFLGDGEWVDSLYPKLCDYVKWDLAHRDRDGNGLVEWAIEGDPHCRSGESGMDNSPRFDSATLLDAVDFNSFLALECEVLAGFANRLGKPEEAKEWNSMHQRLCQLIREKLWSEEHRFFVDYDIEKQAYSPVLASSGFLPLICGAADPGQAAALAQHLEDPRMFGTAFPVPSIAAKDMEHYSKDMWRGPTWINMNWLIAYGLDRYGMEEAAHRLRQQTIHHIEASCEEFGVAFEYFDDRDEVPPPQLKRKGKCAPQESAGHQAFHDYGWTATLYTDLIYSA